MIDAAMEKLFMCLLCLFVAKLYCLRAVAGLPAAASEIANS
jgi:hypothetical protein